MSSAPHPTECEWRETIGPSLVLKGLPCGCGGEPFVSLRTTRVLLAGEKRETAAIGFDVDVSLPVSTSAQPVRYHGAHGCYSSIESFRAQLRGIRHGTARLAQLVCTGFELQLFSHERDGAICVEGAMSTLPSRQWPAEPHGIGAVLIGQGESPACLLRFAFLSSRVDPPCLYDFLRDIDRLIEAIAEPDLL